MRRAPMIWSLLFFCVSFVAVLITAKAKPAAQQSTPASPTWRAEAQTYQAQGPVALTATGAVKRDGTKDRPLLNPCTNTAFHTIGSNEVIRSADVTLSSYSNQFVVNFSLADNDESFTFSEFTATHIAQPIGIILDGQVVSAPIVQAALTTGGQIVGNFTKAEAQSLAVQLGSGALPTPLITESIQPEKDGVRVILGFADPSTADQAIAADQPIIERRLQLLGVSPVTVKATQDHQLQIDLPTLKDPLAVVNTFRDNGLLEFVDFSENFNCNAQMPASGQYILTDRQISRSQAMPTAASTAQ